MITIHWDFTDGTEVSYQEGLDLQDNFTTCCLTFFNQETLPEVLVIKKDKSYISKNNIQAHTEKEIRRGHNIYKLLIGNTFNWKKL